MKVTLLQTDVLWQQPQANVERADCLLRTHAGADLYVLPEMWATGFVTDKQGGVESEDDSVALRWMQQTATEQGCAISGSLAVRTADGLCRNRHYFVTPDALTFYDKHHLFTYGHEDRFFTAGRQSVVVEWLGRRFLLLTCYDLRFPLWARYGRVGEYDAIIVVANWPDSRQQAWRILTRARAIENQCYLIGCNRVGDDQYCHYIGESLVAGPKGEDLAMCSQNIEEAKTVSLDFASLDDVRSRFRVLDDRD